MRGMRGRVARTCALLCGLLSGGCGPLLYPAPGPREASALAPWVGSGDAQVLARFQAPAADRRVIVFFHGNAGCAVDLADLAAAVAADGAGTLSVEYPGYCGAPGSPGEESLLDASERALRELARRGWGPDRVVLVGHSLGSAVAAALAARGLGARLILVAPFTSIVDLVDGWVPFGLGGALVRDAWDTAALARGIAVPTLIVHGEADRVVPPEMGAALAQRIPGAQLAIVAGAGHNDVFARGIDALDAGLAAFARVAP